MSIAIVESSGDNSRNNKVETSDSNHDRSIVIRKTIDSSEAVGKKKPLPKIKPIKDYREI